MKRRSHIFLLLSISIAVIDGVFVFTNHLFSTEAFERNIEAEGRRINSSFDTLLSQTFANMLTMATFIANDREVQNIFLAGKKAVEIEGGGKGGPLATAARKELLDKVGPNWKEVQKEFQVRQLHFHLGPGSTSFLRVHRPDKFGDNMDDVRFTIVDTNAEHTSRSGFETGRVYSGLRGVVPVSAWDKQKGSPVHVGVLEVGTSFDIIFKILDNRTGHGGGVLLTREHIESAMWPDFIMRKFGDGLKVCDCVFEASSRKNMKNIVQQGLEKGINFRDIGASILKLEDTYYAISHFPLRDYIGTKNPERKNVGSVVFWRNADNEMAAFQKSQLFNVGYGILGFFLIEILLFLGFRVATRRLETEVADRTVEISSAKADLERQAAGLVELAEKEAALVEELKYESRVKDRFFSIISHDLKSPFTSLLGMTQMMSQMADSFSKEKLVEYSNNVNDSANKVFDLLQNLLEWSRLQMEGATFEPTINPLNELVDESFETLLPVALDKSIALENKIKKSSVYADPNMTQTVIRNLVANALKFTPSGGTIDVTASKDGGMVRLTVKDSGVGMTREHAEKVFSLDQKTSTKGTEGEPGTGLGLPLCKEMVEKNGGEIWVESNPGEGSRFHFTLPAGSNRE